MPGINEASSQAQLYGALRDGLDTLDLGQEITFNAYTRVVLPVDRYVFWSPTVPLCILGSLHFSQTTQQNADETYGMATVLFTSKEKVTQFTGQTNTLYIATANGFRYAFSEQQGFYSQAGLWHYFGHSIPPAMLSMLLDDPGSIDPAQAVTDNSLALWIALNNYPALYPDFFSNDIPLYPAFMIPANLTPPYGAIDVQETRALQSAPYLDANRNHYQLCADRVQITLYGLQHNAALDFQDCVNQYSVFTGNFGIMNMPVVRDVQRTLPELQTLAQKKVIDFEVSYTQARVNKVARQLIESAPVTYFFE
jgi:hypothetical protein